MFAVTAHCEHRHAFGQLMCCRCSRTRPADGHPAELPWPVIRIPYPDNVLVARNTATGQLVRLRMCVQAS